MVEITGLGTFFDLGVIAVWVSIAAGIAGLYRFLRDQTDKQTAKIKEMIEDRAERVKLDLCKDFQLCKVEVLKFEEALKEHVDDDKEVHKEVSRMAVDVALLNRANQDFQKTLDVHSAEIEDLEGR
jgi:hypothetical protein